MTYVIAEPCIDAKEKTCIDVCKWQAFVTINYAWREGGQPAVEAALADHLNGNG